MADSKTKPGNFMLIHGGWHGGWCWERVANILRVRGHRAWTPTNLGVGEKAHLYSPAINLTTHILDIVNLIEMGDLTDFVLCGHSYGGMIATGVADRMAPRVRSLVYLDAFLPENGQSTFDLNKPEVVADRLAKAGNNGGHTLPPVPAAVFGVNEADRAMVDAKCTPQPFATLCERIALTGAHKTIAKRMYVYATRWQPTPFAETYARLKADPAWITHEVDCGHDVMLDMPERTAELLMAAM
jgi:pimeloyl-ACP methyl ester carboxylesterase